MVSYDKQPVKNRIVEVCAHYLGEGREEGIRVLYVCPTCEKENFAANRHDKRAGCWNRACPPGYTDALGIIAHFEDLNLTRDFQQVLRSGYEILGLSEPERQGRATPGLGKSSRTAGSKGQYEGPGERRSEDHQAPRATSSGERAKGEANGMRWTAGAGSGWASTGNAREERASGGHGRSVTGDGHHRKASPGESWKLSGPGNEIVPSEDVVTVYEAEAEEALVANSTVVESPRRAYAEEKTGLRRPTEACVLEEKRKPNSDNELRDAVYRELLSLCPIHERDVRFWRSRGVYPETVNEGRFGSITARRARWVVKVLKKKFGEEALLVVPGFRKKAFGRIIFTLTGDYTLIPYFDEDSRITTIEGRYTGGSGIQGRRCKYVSLYRSGNHLYVFPRFMPDKVEAFCEGPIGAIVAAQSGIAVGAIQGFRRYRRGSGEEGSLPELRGADFRGRQIPYVPDVDDPPNEEVIREAPKAAEYLIARHNGEPALVGLSEGKDLDEWLLRFAPSERRAAFSHLLSQAARLKDFILEECHSQPTGATVERAPTQAPVGDAAETIDVREAIQEEPAGEQEESEWERASAGAGEEEAKGERCGEQITPCTRDMTTQGPEPETLPALLENSDGKSTAFVRVPGALSSGKADGKESVVAGIRAGGARTVEDHAQAEHHANGHDEGSSSRKGSKLDDPEAEEEEDTDGWYSTLKDSRSEGETPVVPSGVTPAAVCAVPQGAMRLPPAGTVTVGELTVALVCLVVLTVVAWMLLGVVDTMAQAEAIRNSLVANRELLALGFGVLAALLVWGKMSGRRRALRRHLSGTQRR